MSRGEEPVPESHPAYRVAAAVRDPELPMLTLADLGVLRSVRTDHERPGRIVVTIIPTYSGCPAVEAMRADLVRALAGAGHTDVDVRLQLSPPWSTDRISAAGREALMAAGISPPGPASTAPATDPVPLRLGPVRRAVRCPRCGADEVALTSEFGPTACTALYRCAACGEPFEHVKER